MKKFMAVAVGRVGGRGGYVAVRLFRSRWERVQCPDSLMNEAVTLSGSAGSEAPVSPTRWPETEAAVWRDGWGSLAMLVVFADWAVVVNVQEVGE